MASACELCFRFQAILFTSRLFSPATLSLLLGNYIRLWTDIGGGSTFVIEPQQLGNYSLESAWRVDYVLEAAQRMGVHVLIELMSYNSLNDIAVEYGDWSNSPYNQRNGGPLLHPEAFFSNPVARAAFANRARYMVARYAAFDSLLAWELWNEVC